MKLIDNIEISGLTNIVIDHTMHWQYHNTECEWYMIIEKPKDSYYVWKDRTDMADMVRGYLDNKLYRAWISTGQDSIGHYRTTLNIVKREVKSKSSKFATYLSDIKKNLNREHYLMHLPINFYKVGF